MFQDLARLRYLAPRQTGTTSCISLTCVMCAIFADYLTPDWSSYNPVPIPMMAIFVGSYRPIVIVSASYGGAQLTPSEPTAVRRRVKILGHFRIFSRRSPPCMTAQSSYCLGKRKVQTRRLRPGASSLIYRTYTDFGPLRPDNTSPADRIVSISRARL